MLKRLIITGLTTIIFNSVVFSNASDIDKQPLRYKFNRPLLINLGAAPYTRTNDATNQFHHALEKSTGWVFDKGHAWLQPNRVWTRVAYKYFLFPAALSPFNRAVRMTTDFQGRASRLAALGGSPLFVKSNYEDYATNYWSMLGRNVFSSYKAVFTGSVDSVDIFPKTDPNFTSKHTSKFLQKSPQVNLSKLQATAKDLRENDSIDANKVPLDKNILDLRNEAESYLTNKGKVLLRSAGYNASMLHTRYIEDTLWYEDGGHLAQLSNHSIHKLTHAIDAIGVFFSRNDSGKSNSDLGRVSAAYKTLDIDLSWKEMAAHSLITFLGSAEFWSRLFEEGDYISSGDTYVKPPEYKGFRLPNLAFFLNSAGPSYQINTGYRSGKDWFFPLALELVFKGPQKLFEATIGVRKKFTWMNTFVHAEIVGNPQMKAAGGKVAIGMQPSNRFFFDVGARIDHIDTLDGERNIRSLENDAWSISILGSIGLLY